MNKKAFTLIELLAVIVIIAIVMIIAIPNIVGTMQTSRKEALKDFGAKLFDEAAAQLETEKMANVRLGYAGSKFRKITLNSYSITVNQLVPEQNKYKGLVRFVFYEDYDSYDMYLYLYDGEYKLNGVIKGNLRKAEVEADDLKPSSDAEVVEYVNTEEKSHNIT